MSVLASEERERKREERMGERDGERERGGAVVAGEEREEGRGGEGRGVGVRDFSSYVWCNL